MSRQVTINSSAAVIPSNYTGASNLTAGTGNYVPANGYHDHTYTNSSSYYARWTLSAGNTSTDCYVYYMFNVSDIIPSDATITSVTAIVKAYRNNRVTQSTAGVQLYSNTTAKGSSVTNTLGTSATTVNITNGGSWTRSELNNLRLRLFGRRSSTSQTGYLYLCGATVTINYTVTGTEYQVTISNSSDIDCSVDNEYTLQGETAIIEVSSVNDVVIKDNGVDVTNQFVHVQGGTYSLIPSSVDTTNSSVSLTNGTNGCTSHTSTTYATFTPSTTANSTTSVYYNIDTSSIPQNAEVESITCSFRSSWPGGNGTNNSGTTYFTTRQCFLCSGTTKKTTGVTISNTTSSQSTIDTITSTNSWTREELSNLKFLLQGVRTSNTQSVTARFYGATITVTCSDRTIYTISNISADHTIVITATSSAKVYIKVNGSWVQASKVYKKINNVWVEQSDYTSLFDNDKIWISV